MRFDLADLRLFLSVIESSSITQGANNAHIAAPSASERIRASVLKQLDQNPELKEAYQKLVKNLPADQQEKAIATIAARTLRTITPRQQNKGARV